MAGLTDAVAANRIAEQRKAARALLRTPLLRADGAGAGAFVMVTRHARELREWFDRETGWRLLVNSEVARLVKTVPDSSDHTHAAVDRHRKLAFNRRRYVVFCLALATLERADSQVTLGRLAEHIVTAAAASELATAGLTFTLGSRDERSDLVAVVRLLLEFGVLTRVAGDEQAFVDNTGDALYDVRRRITSALLATARGPSMVVAESIEDRLAGVTAELPAASDDERNRRMRFQLTRILLDEPVVYYETLDESELAYLTRQRSAICARIHAFTGLVAEIRAEGIAMVDPFDDLTDVRMPEVGTDGHVTLLVAEWLSRRVGALVPLGELERGVANIAADYVRRRVWKRVASEAGAELELVDIALTKLEALRLVEREPGHVRPLPAIARYGLAEPTVSGSSNR